MPNFFKKIFLTVLFSLFSVYLFSESSDVVKVGYYSFPGYQEGKKEGDRKSGYGYEYLQKIASYTGWTYDYVYGERADLIEQLKTGEIDLLLGLPKPYFIDDAIIYSRHPTVISTYYLFQSPGNREIKAVYPETFRGKKIGLLTNSEGTDKALLYLQEKKIDCDLVYYDNYLDFLNGFYNKSFDAFVATDLELTTGSFVSIIDTIGNHYMYGAISAMNPKVAEQFNDAQDELRESDPLYLENLNNKYFNTRISNLISNRKDFNWLKKNNKLVIACANDYRPFSYEDPKGNFKGLLVDMIQEIGKFVSLEGIEVEYKPYEDYTLAIEDLKAGKADAMFPFFGDLYDAEEHGLQSTKEVYSLSMMLVANKNTDISNFKTIAISKRSPLQELYAKSFYPNSNFYYCNDLSDCLDAVKNHKADVTISNRFKITNYMSSNDFSSFELIALNNECPISFAVCRENVDLLLMLNGSLDQIDGEAKNNSLYNNSYVTPYFSLKDFIVHNALVVNLIAFCLIVFVLVLAHFSVSKTKKRNLVMRKQKEQLETLLREEKISNATISSIAKMYICVYYINLNDFTFKEMDVNDSSLHFVIGNEGNAIEKFEDMHTKFVTPEYNSVMRKFDNLSTLKERLGNKTYISQEFYGPNLGWCEALFIASGSRNSGDISHVIYAVRSIEKEKELLNRSNTDELTGCYNRRLFESDIAELASKTLEEDLIVVSLDVNGLKNANDDIGHDAGDELIIGAARCIERAFGTYGNVYRTGGDEFIACINATEDQYKDTAAYFEELIQSWSGKLIDNLSISYGEASVKNFPGKSITEIVKLSDKSMYEAKELHYSKRGIDRRSSLAAFETLSMTFNKILKVNLATDIYSIMVMDEKEKLNSKELSNTMSQWFKNFADSGMIFEEDREEFLEKANIDYMKEYFKENRVPLTIHYRRMINDSFRASILEVVPVKNYSESNQIVYLYVKRIE